METALHDSPTDGVSALRFSPSDTSLLAAASWDCTVRLYDSVGNTLRASYKHKAPVLDVAFAGAGKLVSGGLDKEVLLHDIEGRGAPAVIGGHDDAIKAVEHCAAHGAIITGSWDRTVKMWDPRRSAVSGAVWSAPLPERVYSLACVGAETLVVATAGRRPMLYDVRKMAAAGGSGENPLLSIREPLLKHPTRVVRGFPDGTGWATGSTEGRVAVDFIDQSPAATTARFAFKCHRQRTPTGEERVFPVHAIAFHPGFGTFATGGGDGGVSFWDWSAKKRLSQLPQYPTSIAALAFSRDGATLAIGVSYMYDEGARDHPADAIVLRTVAESDVRPKAVLRA